MLKLSLLVPLVIFGFTSQAHASKHKYQCGSDHKLEIEISQKGDMIEPKAIIIFDQTNKPATQFVSNFKKNSSNAYEVEELRRGGFKKSIELLGTTTAQVVKVTEKGKAENNAEFKWKIDVEGLDSEGYYIKITEDFLSADLHFKGKSHFSCASI